jgi:hypothetical protein
MYNVRQRDNFTFTLITELKSHVKGTNAPLIPYPAILKISLTFK